MLAGAEANCVRPGSVYISWEAKPEGGGEPKIVETVMDHNVGSLTKRKEVQWKQGTCPRKSCC